MRVGFETGGPLAGEKTGGKGGKEEDALLLNVATHCGYIDSAPLKGFPAQLRIDCDKLMPIEDSTLLQRCAQEENLSVRQAWYWHENSGENHSFKHRQCMMADSLVARPRICKAD